MLNSWAIWLCQKCDGKHECMWNSYNKINLLVQSFFPKHMNLFLNGDPTVESWPKLHSMHLLFFPFNIQFRSVFNSIQLCESCYLKSIYARKVLRIDRRQSHEKPSQVKPCIALRVPHTCEHIHANKNAHLSSVYLYFLILLYNPLFETALTSWEIRYAFKLVTEHWLQTAFQWLFSCFILKNAHKRAYAPISFMWHVYACRNNWVALAATAAIAVTSAHVFSLDVSHFLLIHSFIRSLTSNSIHVRVRHQELSIYIEVRHSKEWVRDREQWIIWRLMKEWQTNWLSTPLPPPITQQKETSTKWIEYDYWMKRDFASLSLCISHLHKAV